MAELRLWFDHGLGDCVHVAYLLQLYRKRGWTLAVHHEENKAFVWRAAGAASAPLDSGVTRHPWAYHPTFNHPGPEWDGSGNKIAENLNVQPLPDLGDPRLLWDELCAAELEADGAVPDAAWDETDRFLEGLPRPLILLHTHGTNFASDKNLGDPATRDLYRLLLERTNGTLILLDWDHRVPKLPHGRVRHLKDDWGHIDLPRLYCLMKRAQLMIGVDSGPWHFSRLAGIPGIGVFHHLYPSCVCLPRPDAVHMVRSLPEVRAVNRSRRSRWNLIEYAGTLPSAEEIAVQAVRVLEGVRYLRDPRRIGRDVQLRQWVQDWCRGGTGSSWCADRNITLDALLRECTSRFAAPRIVETGCIRAPEDWAGGGYSTYLFGAYVEGLGAGSVDSVDVSEANCEFARRSAAAWGARLTVHGGDSVAWLRGRRDPIDLLYLDSLDADADGHAEHALREVVAAEPLLHPSSLVAIDDTFWQGGWAGKGARAVPYLLSRGWMILKSGYQVLLSRSNPMV